MQELPAFVVLAVFASLLAAGHARRCDTEYAVKMHGGDEMAEAMATRCGCTVPGKVEGNIYHFCCPTEALSSSQCMTQMHSHGSVVYVERQVLRARTLRRYVPPSDPSWPMQWYLENDGSLGSDYIPGRDLNVERAWIQGYTGCGVTVGVVDTGMDFTHPDLLPNYNLSLQYDYVDEDPYPFYIFDSHGTESAGVIGMAKNDICGVGVAYQSTITGIRLLGPPALGEESVSDMVEARALGHNTSDIHIFSNSWGPFDDGVTIDGPGPVTQQVLQTAVTEGRDGKGNIYVFAAGNGGTSDHCGTDGYVNSIYTIGVGAAASNGEQAEFDEECSAKLAVAFAFSTSGILVTSTLPAGECSSGFTGTSAAAPQVSGAVALALEANPDLTWRDVQYLIALTCNTSVLVDGEWAVNGAGLMVSHKFGFGAVDAEALVILAQNWENVPPQQQVNISFPSDIFDSATASDPFELTFTYEEELGILSLEHVVVVIDLETFGEVALGDIQIDLMSPSGTISTLLGYRDNNVPGSFNNWPLMSVHFWGEDPTGEWTITVQFREPSVVSEDSLVDVQNINVVFYGTAESVLEEQECTPCDLCGGLRDADTLTCSDDDECTEDFTERNGYCYNATLPEPECDREQQEPLPASCISAGYSGCCVPEDDEDCEANGEGCYCDSGCFEREDCCYDVQLLCPPACDPENEFTCTNGQCVPIEYLCDAIVDCNDGSDEPDDCDLSGSGSGSASASGDGSAPPVDSGNGSASASGSGSAVVPTTCVEAGLTGGCCTGACFVSEGNCFCDRVCHSFGDCCTDIFDIGCFSDARVGFTAQVYSVNEGAGAIELQVAAQQPIPGNTTVTLSLTIGAPGDNATAGEDYLSLSNLQVRLSSEQQTATVSLSIVDDDVFEATESFSVELQLVSVEPLEEDSFSVIIDPGQATIIILDDDFVDDSGSASASGSGSGSASASGSGSGSVSASGSGSAVVPTTCTEAGFTSGCCTGACLVSGGNCFCDRACHSFGDCCTDIFDIGCFSDVVVGFTAQSYSVNEGAGVVELQVQTQQPLVSHTVNLSITTGAPGDNATAGEDYVSLTEQQVQLSPEQQIANITLDIVDDDIFEETESFSVQLELVDVEPFGDIEAPQINVDVSPNQTTVFISDNDADVVVGFTAQFYSVNEGAGVVQLQVQTQQPLASNVVTLAISTGAPGDNATAGEDYTSLSELQVQLSPEQPNVTVLLTIVDDVIFEETESLSVQLQLLDVEPFGDIEASSINVVVSPNQTTVFISDNDIPPVDGSGNGSAFLPRTCAEAGLTDGCCTSGCFVPEGNCFCDSVCHSLGDCCTDIFDIGCFPDVVVGFTTQSYSVNEGAGVVELQVQTQQPLVSHTVNLSITTGAPGDNATAGEDYISLTEQQVQLSPEQQIANITLDIVDDDIFEETESFSVQLELVDVEPFGDIEAPQINVDVSPNQATVFISDNDADVVVGFTAQSYSVNEGAGVVQLQVETQQPLVSNVITLAISTGAPGDNATAGEDYTSLSELQVQLSPEQPIVTVVLTIVDDVIFEETESFSVQLQLVDVEPFGDIEAPQINVVVSPNQTTVFISDNDVPPVDGSGSGSAFLPRTCAEAGLTGGCCNAGCFVPEGNCFCDRVCHSLGDCCVDIFDIGCFPDVVVGFTAQSFSVNEGAGVVELQVQTQQPLASNVVTLAISTGAPGDNATAGEDYTSLSELQVQLSPEQQIASITLSIVDDVIVEETESFSVQLELVDVEPFGDIEAPQINVVVSPNQTTVVISDNDVPPDLELRVEFENAAVQVDESNMFATLSVTLIGSGSAGQLYTIGITTEPLFGGDTANEFDDYEPINGVLTFSEGARTQLIIIQLNDDNLYERSESFSVRLFNLETEEQPAVTILQDTATVTIIDDDNVEFGFEPVMYVVEENQQSIEISARVIAGELGTSITTSILIADATTTGGSDYILPNPSLITFEPNEEAADPLFITIINDAVSEDEEQLILIMTVEGLDNPNFLVRPNHAIVSIIDDDDVVIGFEQDQYLVSENANSVTVTVSVLEGQVSEAVVSLVTVDLEAVGGEDYDSTIAQLPFTAFTTSFQVSIPIFQEEIPDEGDEQFLVEITLVSSQGFVQLDPSQVVVVIRESVEGLECGTGGVRLLGGASSTEGRVEVCVDGVWSSVCDSSWDYREATVVCRQLGLPYSGGVALPGGVFGSEDTPANITDVMCEGQEVALLQCSHSRNIDGVCNTDAGVLCREGVEDCRCRRSIECSIDGNFLSGVNVGLVGSTLTCTINFEDDILDLEAKQIDDFEVDFLSHGSAIFLKELGIISTAQVEFSDCEADNVLVGSGNPSVVLRELGVQQLQLLYLIEDGTFDNLFLNIQQLEYIFLTGDYSFNGSLDGDNACAFQHLTHWLTTNSRLPISRCRQPGPSLSTIVTFDVFC